ncbi:bifunctional 5,10-methylenetetrahydrofolate dehydrogenase/5,10-methenyltetrahydrofolate cyclohydrolase [Bombilactobacillus bombi]|uniref:bifunctional 5,10-methylenetetrahydrofolate dehydrogenase/5,10-methenyltetrahydrofolate cyclohydrolase n=1 Tax=Bombilactobacillus bombi TaxID=1303590 RepID=UPI0015E5F4FF|nr:tetrahydrofolate dehydrogenase/cyclohydrolase catalytic domain-containing protein [Bombilactobacillus bombi]MBA1435138.1 bifunctional methylenetetrahydrofolate dehydrogenase/methenyltetrahydrofolate cyclohydrolase [Bombilactobacillus bombi]
MVKILSGIPLAQQMKKDLQLKVQSLKKQKVTPTLATVIVGPDAASLTYAKNEQRQARALGINYQVHSLPKTTSQLSVVNLLEHLNNAAPIDAILLQLPLPQHLQLRPIIAAIDTCKDVDGLTNENVGRLWNGAQGNFPATARAVIALLKYYHIKVASKHIVILSRSEIVGKPLAAMLLKQNATVTIAHSHTRNLAALTQRADILIVAIGQAQFITDEYLSPQTIVVDVGTNLDSTGKLVGDVDFQRAQNQVSMLTPVPGGIGPVTVACLLEQVIKIAQKRVQINDR